MCFNIGLKNLGKNCSGGYPPKQGESNYALRIILHLGLLCHFEARCGFIAIGRENAWQHLKLPSNRKVVFFWQEAMQMW